MCCCLLTTRPSLPPSLPPSLAADPIEKEIAAIAKASAFLPERYFSFGLCKTMEAVGIEVGREGGKEGGREGGVFSEAY